MNWVEIVTAIAAIVAAAAAVVQAYIEWRKYHDSRPSRGGGQGTRTRPSQPTLTVPWGWLTGVLAVYGIRGFLLSSVSAPIWAYAWASLPMCGYCVGLLASAAIIIKKTDWSGYWKLAAQRQNKSLLHRGEWVDFVIMLIFWIIMELFAIYALGKTWDGLGYFLSDNNKRLICVAIVLFGLGLGWLAHQMFG